jgi:peptidyl-tRNA hydrolase, PTH1 family
MKLIVGLGNPGKQYTKQRHNAGFMAVDYWRDLHKWPAFHLASDWQSEVCEHNVGHQKVILAKPQTMMNNSGQAVQKLSWFYKAQPKDILLVYDELALPFGKVRTREEGSSAGHNGVESVISTLGDEFVRLRIGIANNHLNNQDTADFVLSNFSGEEAAQLPHILEYTADCIEQFINTSQLSSHTKDVLDQSA